MQALIKYQTVQTGDHLSFVLEIKTLRKFIIPYIVSLTPLHKNLSWL